MFSQWHYPRIRKGNCRVVALYCGSRTESYRMRRNLVLAMEHDASIRGLPDGAA
jgi:hypothetical protein